MTLLNLGGDFPNQLVTVVIKAEHRSKFSGRPEEDLIGKTVRIMGKMTSTEASRRLLFPTQFSLFPLWTKNIWNRGREGAGATRTAEIKIQQILNDWYRCRVLLSLV